jgi:hypothetical protein
MISLTRRRLLAAAAALPVVPAFAQTRPLTCGVLTAQQTEGPFFKIKTPLRASFLEPQSKAPRLIVSGRARELSISSLRFETGVCPRFFGRFS